jgi:hypothetical protein
VNRTIKKGVLLFLISIILFVIIVFAIKPHSIHTDLKFCEEVGREISRLNLQQFHCESIKGCNQITFYFVLNDYDDYSEKECINDIIKVRTLITEYLKNHPNNKLSNSRVMFVFETFPGDGIYMYNYDYNDKERISDGFDYFYHLFADITLVDSLKDVRVIDLRINSTDQLHMLEDWNNLERLNIVGYEMSKEEQEYLVGILPECTITCKNKIISD